MRVAAAVGPDSRTPRLQARARAAAAAGRGAAGAAGREGALREPAERRSAGIFRNPFMHWSACRAADRCHCYSRAVWEPSLHSGER